MEVRGQLPASPARGEGGKSPPPGRGLSSKGSVPLLRPQALFTPEVSCVISLWDVRCRATLTGFALGIWDLGCRSWSKQSLVADHGGLLPSDAAAFCRGELMGWGSSPRSLAFGVPTCKGQDGIPAVGLPFWMPHFHPFVVLFQIH